MGMMMAKTDFLRAGQDDRRKYVRLKPVALMARIGNQLLEIHDISLSGISVVHGKAPLPLGDGLLEITLIPRDGRHLNVNSSLRVKGRVVRHHAHASAIAFEGFSFALAKMITGVMARHSGVEPFLIR